MRVFVYGTLKRGYGNNRLLDNSTFVENAVLKDHSAIYSFGTGGFPVAFPAEGKNLTGEIWDISGPHKKETLRRLDALEGEGYMYHRIYNEELDASYYLGGSMWNVEKSVEVPAIAPNTHEWSRG